jgi:hypothetical protein
LISFEKQSTNCKTKGGNKVIPLENVLEELEQAEEQEVQKVFAVTDLESAAEAQRRIAYFEEKKSEIDAIIEKQITPFLEKIEKIKAWGEQAKVEYIEKQAGYSAHLEQYLRAEIEKQVEEGKKAKKTLKLPYGKISLKAQQPEFQRNNEELLPYAKGAGYAKMKWDVEWAELKKACTVVGDKLIDANGEFVPGVVVIEREEKFECKLDK